jgi:hypothetical protein
VTMRNSHGCRARGPCRRGRRPSSLASRGRRWSPHRSRVPAAAHRPRQPLIAFAGVVTNLASIAGAFGVAKLIFQDGHLSGLLHFEPQGFIDAWAPLFFGAMLSGVAMDYTLFLLSAAWATYDRTGDPQQAMPTALRTSGRVVVAAAEVMVAVFLAFALSGPLASKEMGIILPSSSTRCSSGSSYCPSSCG